MVSVTASSWDQVQCLGGLSSYNKKIISNIYKKSKSSSLLSTALSSHLSVWCLRLSGTSFHQVVSSDQDPLKEIWTCRCGLGEDQQPLSVWIRLQSDFSHLNSAAESLIRLWVRWIWAAGWTTTTNQMLRSLKHNQSNSSVCVSLQVLIVWSDSCWRSVCISPKYLFISELNGSLFTFSQKQEINYTRKENWNKIINYSRKSLNCLRKMYACTLLNILQHILQIWNTKRSWSGSWSTATERRSIGS